MTLFNGHRMERKMFCQPQQKVTKLLSIGQQARMKTITLDWSIAYILTK